MKYRKKPVEIEAVQWTGVNLIQMQRFVGMREDANDLHEYRFLTPPEVSGVWERPHVYDEVQAEWIPVNDRDYIIRGVQGEFYPCRSDIFAATYEAVSA